MKIQFLILSLLLAGNAAQANRTEHFEGVAKDGSRIVYIEKHEVEYDLNGKLISAKTKYETPDGKPIAELDSDFSKSVTTPDHIIRDLRTGNIEGMRSKDGEMVLFDQEKGKQEKTRVVKTSDSDQRILVGCQGLNYYVLNNLENFDPEKVVPLRFLIPGKLDYYDFDMKEVESKDRNLAEFEIKVKNWFLKIFAPTLRVRYDKKTKKIVWYEGISNILSDSGGTQKVTIDYHYEGDNK